MEASMFGIGLQRAIRWNSIYRAAVWQAAMALCLLGAEGQAATFDAIYAFGDSLTDTGREPAEPFFHYQGRWSNGPLWVEYLSTRLGLPYLAANNYAHSGAQVDDMVAQVAEFSSPVHLERALVVAWAGGNDFTQTYDKNWIDDEKWDAQIQHAMTNYFQVLTALRAKGARTILVPNTVDLSQIPLLNRLPGLVRDYLRSKVRQFNRSLWQVLDQLSAAYPEVRLVRFDAYQAFDQVLANPDQYGFTETKIDVLADFLLFDKRFNGPGRNYLFWDPLHPTTKSHSLIAEWFETALTTADPVRLALARTGNGFELLARSTQPGRSYQLEQSTNLIDWSELSRFTSTTNSFRISVPFTETPCAAFRLKESG